MMNPQSPKHIDNDDDASPVQIVSSASCIELEEQRSRSFRYNVDEQTTSSPGQSLRRHPSQGALYHQARSGDGGSGGSTRRRGCALPRPSVSVVIGGLVAFVVLIVAVATLTLAYSVAAGTLREIGRDQAAALADSAQRSVERYFALPAAQLGALQKLTLLDAMVPPSTLPQATRESQAAHEQLWHALYGHHSAAGFTYASVGVLFDDGSNVIAYTHGDALEYCVSRFRDSPSASTFTMRLFAVDRRTSTAPSNSSATITAAVGVIPANVDTSVLSAYTTSRAILAGGSSGDTGFWYPPVLHNRLGTVQFIMPGVAPLVNSAGAFLGVAIVNVPIDAVGAFLATIRGTENTHAFAIDRNGLLLAATHPAPFSTVRLSSRSEPVPAGCVSNADTATDLSIAIYQACRVRASEFVAYPPLVAATQDTALITATTLVERDIEVDGKGYFVAGAPVQNPLRQWGVRVVLCIPEDDILGRVVRGRNLAIGVTLVIFVVAAASAFALVLILLRPLSDVSRRMLDTAQLQEPSAAESEEGDRKNSNKNTEDAFSSLAEIRDLQKAYANMNTAIRSFTRYVPRDVVKDLMATGELCAIRMAPRHCTMLFADIAGFTSVCERVPTDTLSMLVSEYFDRASKIVMAHDGVIDKFIGDCIMAVWGAPFEVANHEVKATLAARLLDRETAVEPLSRLWDDAGERLSIRVGISTGDVLAGNMGSQERMNYTVIGDDVNLAARLESLNKQFATRVMVSEHTAMRIDDGVFVLRLVMPIAVVGKDRPVRVFEVLGLAPQIESQQLSKLDAAERACPRRPSLAMSNSGRRNHGTTPKAATLATGGSGTATATEDDTTHSGMAGHRRQRAMRSAGAMVREAIRSTSAEASLTCSVDEVLYAARYTAAVEAYLRRDCAAALTTLSQIETEAPEDVRATPAAQRGLKLLRELCEGCLQHGCPDRFDGTWRAAEK